MRILLTDKHYEGEIDVEREAAPSADFDIFTNGEDVTADAWSEAEGILTYRSARLVTEKLDELARCRIIVRGGVGFDGLDLERFGQRGVAICNVPDYGTTEVADHAIALFLALRRGIVSFHDRLREDPAGNWTYRHGRLITRLRGARFGVVGLGRIGTAAARRAKGFDQQVVFYDPNLPPGTDLATGFERAETLAELLASVDAVSLHTPLNESSHALINAETLAQMKPGAVLVNTSRGPVVDIDAVYDALRDGHLGGAALDVLPVEPPADHPLVRAYTAREPWIDGRLILSPHSAFFSVPGQTDLRRKAIETIAAYLEQGVLRNCVNEASLRRNR